MLTRAHISIKPVLILLHCIQNKKNVVPDITKELNMNGYEWYIMLQKTCRWPDNASILHEQLETAGVLQETESAHECYLRLLEIIAITTILKIRALKYVLPAVP